MLTPRDYQQEAHDAVVASWRRSTAPVLVEAATGSGKSVIIALIAKTLFDLSGGKRVLCLAPSGELVKQNAGKYRAIGEPCSIFSASVGKSLAHKVVFATEGTFKSVAKRLGPQFAGVIVDEAHRITPTVQGIISDMREGNPNLRVAGLSATPYRLGEGFIFRIAPDEKALPEAVAKSPYFHQCVYSIGARTLIDRGFLTPLHAAAINSESYDTSGLKVQANGQYSAATVAAAFEGWGRKTAGIVADVVAQTQSATGVMIFAATLNHAREVMASLHPDNARLITGETPKPERAKIIEDFEARRFLYLVNVGTLTTGFDAPNVSHIAILRATESVSLLQQIMGRAMRLYPGKAAATILDYAENIERHMPEGDLYKPQIKASYQSAGEPLECACEWCGRINLFSKRKNDDGFGVDKWGYFTGTTGDRVMIEVSPGNELPMPAHYGRRCQHMLHNGERCGYYWASKECPVCANKNDIAARFCGECKAELVNPNDKLIAMHKQHKADPTRWQCDEIISMISKRGLSRAGNDMVTLSITTPRRMFQVYLTKTTQSMANHREWVELVTRDYTETPRTVTYRKKDDFWTIGNFNQPTDEEALNDKLAGAAA